VTAPVQGTLAQVLTDSSVFGDCDVTSQRCCGANNVYPVYINTELQGCFTPLIPGFKRLITDLLFECDAIPDTLTGPPTILALPHYPLGHQIRDDTALIRRPVVSVPGGRTYYLNGCFGIPPLTGGLLGGVFNLLTSLLLPNISPATLGGCAAACNSRHFDAFGMVNGR